MSNLDVRDVDVRFDADDVLRGAALTVASGEVVALLGPSGSGKSTLLRVIAGILAPDAGSVHLDGVDVTSVPTHRRGIGMVFQDNQLFTHMSTVDNVAFGLKMAGVGRDERRTTAADWLRRVGLDGFGDRRVTELSGGEAKRVALARTLAPEPAVVLLDEPLTGLDRALHDRLADDLAGLLADHGMTAVLVTHDPDEAATVATRSVRMSDVNAALGHRSPPRAHVVEISADATHDLRRRVLRVGTPSTDVAWDGDDDRTTVHLGVIVGDDGGTDPIGISSWLRRPSPESAHRWGVQLRGMATDPDPAIRGHGLGSLLLRAGIERARADGADHVWANARCDAVGFYTAHGFEVVGDEFESADTAIAHRRILLDLT